MENHRNVITKREVNVGKNITVYCGKNITPKHGQNPSKMSIANKNNNIAHDNMLRDTKSHYSCVKVSQKTPKTMDHYTDMKNGQRCESDNNSHSINNGIVQRCDSANNSQSRTSNQTGKAKGQANYTTSVKNRFWPLCTQDKVKPSSHGPDHMVSVRDNDINTNKNVSELVNHNNKCQLPPVKDTRASQNKVNKQGTVSAPQNKASDIVNQNDQVTDNVSDPDKYALDLRFRPRHRLIIQEARNCRTFKLWDEQMLDKFGYIPLQDQTIPSGDNRKASIPYQTFMYPHL